MAGSCFCILPSAKVSMPMIPFMGVRISWDMRERKVVLDWLASSTCMSLVLSSSRRWCSWVMSRPKIRS